MSIIKNNAQLNNALEIMLQGLAFWMGYNRCMNILYEHDCVHEAFSILRAHLDKSRYSLEYEYNYSDIDPNIDTRERADLVVLEKTSKRKVPICVLEFKMSTNTNGGVEDDVEKLRRITKGDNLLKFVVLLINEDKSDLVSQFADGKMNSLSAKRKATLKDGSFVKVRRLAKAMATADNPKRNPFMAFCIEP